jgi:hypothetical protein
MTLTLRVILAATVVLVLGGPIGEASARPRLYPLTRCGPDLAFLCPIHGYFDSAPFHYNLAIYPGCIKSAAVETPRGVRKRLVVVCG